MYRTYFKLARNPFNLTPDPACFVPTKRHDEALAALYHGVRQHKGFVVLTGEVGTGKTLLIRCLLGLLKESKDIAYAYLFNGRLSPTEFLQYILSDFGLPATGKSKYELLLDLGRFLGSRGSMNMTTVLIVDEAHHLSADILEEVRLLSNLETTDDKLLQIVLVGQPELDQKLDSVELRQLKQRIAVRTELGALRAYETKRYIEQRLQIAGEGPHSVSLFSDEAILTVYRYSRGLPRLINTICENSLIAAYARRLSSVTPEIVRNVAKEFRLDPAPSADAEWAEELNHMDAQPARNALIDPIAALEDAMQTIHTQVRQ
ncbi:MAG: AAA family ATPase [Terracidiphilus sp.]|jgi:type II secretory pathway predicted ATPase ExeA